jgi:hypothetical protein
MGFGYRVLWIGEITSNVLLHSRTLVDNKKLNISK